MLDANRFQLPQIKMGGGRNLAGNHLTDQQSLVMGGSVGGNRFNIGQQSPFIGKIGHDLDSIQSSQYTGKMTPMYEKQN